MSGKTCRGGCSTNRITEGKVNHTMKVSGSTIQQLDRLRKNGTPMPRSECRRWRLWATTEEGRKSRRFEGTYTQAQEALKAFVAELEGIVPNSDTFASYAESWRLWREESGNYSPNTVRADGYRLAGLLRTDLADMRMDGITPQACREALTWLRHSKVGGGEYSQNSMASFHNLLNKVMAQAVSDGMLAENPMRDVQRPKVGKTGRTALSPDEISLLLNRLDDLPLSGYVVAVYLMACLGLRCGEACALRDDEVMDGFAHVTSTVRGADNSIGPTKSEAGNRVLPVPPRLEAKIREWRALRDRLGWHDVPTLCCNYHGSMISTSAMGIWWCNVRKDIGCDGMVMHELRHSNLSMMARHMSVFDLQRYAGWSTIAPASIYVHDDMGAVVRAVEMAWA